MFFFFLGFAFVQSSVVSIVGDELCVWLTAGQAAASFSCSCLGVNSGPWTPCWLSNCMNLCIRRESWLRAVRQKPLCHPRATTHTQLQQNHLPNTHTQPSAVSATGTCCPACVCGMRCSIVPVSVTPGVCWTGCRLRPLWCEDPCRLERGQTLGVDTMFTHTLSPGCSWAFEQTNSLSAVLDLEFVGWFTLVFTLIQLILIRTSEMKQILPQSWLFYVTGHSGRN